MRADVCSPPVCGARGAGKFTVVFRASMNVGGVGQRQTAPVFVGASPVGF